MRQTVRASASALMDTPLVTSRSLGALLGFDALYFKLEIGQPTGSWLDRAAADQVAEAAGERVTGLLLVAGALDVPLAVQCARAGLRLVLLRPVLCLDGGRMPERAPAEGWLAALGARQIAVGASAAELTRAAESIAVQAGLRFVDPDRLSPGNGLAAVAAEIARAGLGASVLATPAITGQESRALTALYERTEHAVPLPLDVSPGRLAGRANPLTAVVGELAEPSAGSIVAADDGPGPAAPVLSVRVTRREADAAQLVLAREEGLLVSARGGLGLAAVIRAVREDRARRPREQRLPRHPSAVVILTGDPLGLESGPPRATDVVPARSVALADLAADPRRWLVEPPEPVGRGGTGG